MDLNMPGDLVVVDVETNGADYPDTRITQIGAVRLEANSLKEIGFFKSYVRGLPLLPISIKITGITEEIAQNAPDFLTAGKDFAHWCGKAYQKRPYMLAAWGSHFDYPVLRWEYLRTTGKFPLEGKITCIKSRAQNYLWARDIPTWRTSVVTVLDQLDLPIFEGHEHDALDDARNEARILRVLMGLEPPGPAAFTRPLGPDDQISPYDRPKEKP
jgi:DNA polymerase III epsilon subunit-like protein